MLGSQWHPKPGSLHRTPMAYDDLLQSLQAAPLRSILPQPAATMVGNMVVRKKRTDAGVELSWDGAPNVVEWTLRVSTRPDPRQAPNPRRSRSRSRRHDLADHLRSEQAAERSFGGAELAR